MYSGTISGSMNPSSSQPDVPFKLEIIVEDCTDITGLVITGMYGGVAVQEITTIDGNNTVYSENMFDTVTTIVSKSFQDGSTITINTVDEAYQPVFWELESDPYECTFSTIDGMSSSIQSESSGLRTVLTHYVRMPISAPVQTNMEFEISMIGCPVGRLDPYSGVRYVPITDFDIVCLPPKYLPVEWAFRCTKKSEE